MKTDEDDGGLPSSGAMRRLAEALHTTVEHLSAEQGIDPDMATSRSAPDEEPPALVGGPAARPVVSRLAPEECRILMRSVPVGRVSFSWGDAPDVLPVNFQLMGEDIAMQTSAMSRLAELGRAGRRVGFEVDDFDPVTHLGWSVMCKGPVHTRSPDDPSGTTQLPAPWFGRDRNTLVMLSPQTITGRRIGLH